MIVIICYGDAGDGGSGGVGDAPRDAGLGALGEEREGDGAEVRVAKSTNFLRNGRRWSIQ